VTAFPIRVSRGSLKRAGNGNGKSIGKRERDAIKERAHAHRPSLCSGAPLRRLIESNIPISDLLDARIALHVVATDVMSGEEVLLSSGDAKSAVLASAAIPAVFAPVPPEARVLMDGSVANNAAVSQAIALGAERIVVLPAGFACALRRQRHRSRRRHMRSRFSSSSA
jgi:predicted acylesterase/phospholipase RssA